MKKDTNYEHGITSGSAVNYRSGLAYLLIGGGIGATLALLFAPKAGRQLRGDIADVTRRGYDAAADKARNLKESSGELAHAVKEKADAVYDFAARKAGSGIDTAIETAENAASAAGKLASETNNAADRLEGIRKSANLG